MIDVDELADKVADRVVAKIRQQPDLRSPLKAKAVAERLGVSERTVRDMIDRGTIRSFKVGDSRLVDQAVVDAYLAERRAGG